MFSSGLRAFGLGLWAKKESQARPRLSWARAGPPMNTSTCYEILSAPPPVSMVWMGKWSGMYVCFISLLKQGNVIKVSFVISSVEPATEPLCL